MFAQLNPAWLYLAAALTHLLFGRFGSTLIYWIRFRANPNVDLRKSLGSSATDQRHFRTTQILAVAYLSWVATLSLTWFSRSFHASILGRPLVELPAIYGWSVATLAFIGMIIAQLSMGRAFRIGQDNTAKTSQTELRQDGFLRVSRNPIYIFSFLYLVGVTLWGLGPLPIAACVTFGLGIHNLVLREEAFLLGQFGHTYLTYCYRTPRYLLLHSTPIADAPFTAHKEGAA